MRTPSQHHQAEICLSDTPKTVTAPRMKPIAKPSQPGTWLAATRLLKGASLALPLLLPAYAHASMFKGETLDNDRRRAHLGRAGHCADRRYRRLLCSHPAGEDRREETAPAGQGHPVPVPALAGVRRHALAARLAVGLHQAGFVQAGLRHRQGWRTATRRRHPTPNKDEAEELKQLRKRVAELETKQGGKVRPEGGKA